MSEQRAVGLKNIVRLRPNSYDMVFDRIMHSHENRHHLN